MFSKLGEIRRDDACLDYSNKDVVLFSCHGSRGNQEWQWQPHNNMPEEEEGEGWTGRLRHGISGKCLAVSELRDRLVMEPCRAVALRQLWRFGSFNRTAAADVVVPAGIS